MWKHAARYMTRKGIPRPGEFDPRNIHGGQLWGTRKECKLTDKMAGEIIERCYESGKVGLDQDCSFGNESKKDGDLDFLESGDL